MFVKIFISINLKLNNQNKYVNENIGIRKVESLME